MIDYVKNVFAAVESAKGPVVVMPTSGGTGPNDAMERATGTKVINVAIANHDDNQHAANENLRMQNLWHGIGIMAALLAMK